MAARHACKAGARASEITPSSPASSRSQRRRGAHWTGRGALAHRPLTPTPAPPAWDSGTEPTSPACLWGRGKPSPRGHPQTRENTPAPPGGPVGAGSFLSDAVPRVPVLPAALRAEPSPPPTEAATVIIRAGPFLSTEPGPRGMLSRRARRAV